MKVFAISLIVVGAISIWLATLMTFNIGDVGGYVIFAGGGHMESMVWVYLYGVIFTIIALSGAIICIRGFIRSRRYLFAYAAIFFPRG